VCQQAPKKVGKWWASVWELWDYVWEEVLRRHGGRPAEEETGRACMQRSFSFGPRLPASRCQPSLFVANLISCTPASQHELLPDLFPVGLEGSEHLPRQPLLPGRVRVRSLPAPSPARPPLTPRLSPSPARHLYRSATPPPPPMPRCLTRWARPPTLASTPTPRGFTSTLPRWATRARSCPP
jgi:hypothetical protein